MPAFGCRCEVIVEIVTPHDRSNDVEAKFDHYYRIGVPLYVIVDHEEWDRPRSLLAYRWTTSGYEGVKPDERGLIAVPPVGLLLGLANGRVVCHDARDGEVIPDYVTACKWIEVAKELLAQREQLQQWLDEDKKCRERLAILGPQIDEGYRRLCQLKEQRSALQGVAHLNPND